MDMEGTPEEFVGSSNNDVSLVVVKGKRTKRPRPSSPCGVATVTSSSSSASADHVSGDSGGGDYGSFSSTTTAYESTEEEEDMANCLILLARGGDAHKKVPEDHSGKTEKVSGRKFAEIATVCAASKVGFYVYECKTCNRTFPSFQALGGHRASHKKPKTAVEEKKPPTPPGPPPQALQQNNNQFEGGGQPHMIKSTQISLQLSSNKGFNSNKTKIHECSICGSEFTSGQALGGHMRRHRASTSTNSPVVDVVDAADVEVKPRNILELDLNLPAPEDDVRDMEFEFTATQKSLMLSAPALVGCHY